MGHLLKEFFEKVFDVDDTYCWTEGKPYWKGVVGPVEDTARYVKINATNGESKEDVYKYRTFLVEFDEISLEKQLEVVKSLELPFTTAVYSGNKSYHFLIVLDTPVDETMWQRWADWLRNILVPHGADPSVFNPNRYTRVARDDQPLIEKKERVSIIELVKWLSKFPKAKPETKADLPTFQLEEERKDKPTFKTMPKPGNRYQWFLKVTWLLKTRGFPEEEGFAVLKTLCEEYDDIDKQNYINTIKRTWAK